MEKYITLKENTLGYELNDYNSLPVNSNGIKKAEGVPDGTALEVFNNLTGKIEAYAEAINELWFER